MTRRIHAPLLVLLLHLLWACGGTAPAGRDNLAHLYGKESTILDLRLRPYHPDTGTTVMHFKLRTSDLLYKSPGGGRPYRANVRMTYEAFPQWGSRTLLDSASTWVVDEAENTDEDKELIGTLLLDRIREKTFVVRVTAHDLNRELRSSAMVAVDRSEPASRQFYLPIDPVTGTPLFTDQFPGGTTLRLRCEAHAGRTIHGGYHRHEVSLPTPVFTPTSLPAISDSPDSLFSFDVDADGRFDITLPSNGFIHLKADLFSPVGLTLFSLNESHPQVRTGEDMLKPLRYITSLQEYDRMARSDDVRKAVERFWSDAAGNRDRAREAIRAYYGRVESANRHFTSHVEGWKTDRGLVHIIFGTPNTIHKNARSETWVYGDETNIMSLSFTFVKRDGVYTDNDLILERQPVYKGAWYRNVESWRNGRILQN